MMNLDKKTINNEEKENDLTLELYYQGVRAGDTKFMIKLALFRLESDFNSEEAHNLIADAVKKEDRLAIELNKYLNKEISVTDLSNELIMIIYPFNLIEPLIEYTRRLVINSLDLKSDEEKNTYYKQISRNIERILSCSDDQGIEKSQAVLKLASELIYNGNYPESAIYAILNIYLESNNPYVTGLMANYYLRNKEVEKAFFWFKKAYELDDINSCYPLGVMYLKGAGTEKNLKLAKEAFKYGASKGCENSLKMLNSL